MFKALSVSNSVELSENTTIGDITYKDLKTVINKSNYLDDKISEGGGGGDTPIPVVEISQTDTIKEIYEASSADTVLYKSLIGTSYVYYLGKVWTSDSTSYSFELELIGSDKRYVGRYVNANTTLVTMTSSMYEDDYATEGWVKNNFVKVIEANIDTTTLDDIYQDEQSYGGIVLKIGSSNWSCHVVKNSITQNIVMNLKVWLV